MMANEGFTVWITGKPGVAPGALARALEDKLLERGLNVERLDAEELQAEWLSGWACSREAQVGFERFLSHLCRLFNRNGVITIGVGMAFFPEGTREPPTELDGFVLVFLDSPPLVGARKAPSDECCGTSSGSFAQSPGPVPACEGPVLREIVLETDTMSLGACCLEVLGFLEKLALIPAGEGSDYDPEDEAKITESLRDLGYL